MKVTAPIDCYVTGLNALVSEGEEVDVDADLGAGLVEQGWTSARQTAARKREAAQRKENEPDGDAVVEPDPEGVPPEAAPEQKEDV